MSKKKKTRDPGYIDHGIMESRREEKEASTPEGRLAALLRSVHNVEIGDVVIREAVTLTYDSENRRMFRGTVVYIHPEGRYHTVEFRFKNGATVRESFLGVER
ncbi:MAG: hypothetical protein J6M06_00970 [Synergistaceae bacterium]|nr:hypothetical protein [Synergistaceae bacterium]